MRPEGSAEVLEARRMLGGTLLQQGKGIREVAQVIQEHFAIVYHPGHVWRILRDLGWSPQKPDRRARERDEDAITAWRDETWPRIKKKPTTTPGASS
jgi:hypothetical protein